MDTPPSLDSLGSVPQARHPPDPEQLPTPAGACAGRPELPDLPGLAFPAGYRTAKLPIEMDILSQPAMVSRADCASPYGAAYLPLENQRNGLNGSGVALSALDSVLASPLRDRARVRCAATHSATSLVFRTRSLPPNSSRSPLAIHITKLLRTFRSCITSGVMPSWPDPISNLPRPVARPPLSTGITWFRAGPGIASQVMWAAKETRNMMKPHLDPT
ncbi:hypothetical protein V2G26_008395 [Clonostachys chloroleuca]